MGLVARSQGRLCVRFIQRPDGGILTRTAPERLYRISRRVSRIAAGAFTATLTLSSSAAQTKPASTTSQPGEAVVLGHTNLDRKIITDEFSAHPPGPRTS